MTSQRDKMGHESLFWTLGSFQTAIFTGMFRAERVLCEQSFEDFHFTWSSAGSQRKLQNMAFQWLFFFCWEMQIPLFAFQRMPFCVSIQLWLLLSRALWNGGTLWSHDGMPIQLPGASEFNCSIASISLFISFAVHLYRMFTSHVALTYTNCKWIHNCFCLRVP